MIVALTPRTAGSPTHRGGRGFTLIESMVTLTVLAVLLAVAAPLVSSAVDGYAHTAMRTELANETSLALDRVVTELRGIPIRSDVSTAAPAVTGLTPTSITWHDGCSLSLVGTDLRLVTSNQPARILLSDVQAFSLRAFDESNSALAPNIAVSECDAIRRIGITLTATRQGATETLRTRVFLRCMVAGAAP